VLDYPTHRITPLRREENGQMAIAVVLALPVVFVFFGLAMDAGLWFLDHRLAQNQTDAAVLAAVQELPAEDTDAVAAVVDTWLTKNGSGPEDLGCRDGSPSPQFFDRYPVGAPDGRYDEIHVCVRRQSPGIFAGFFGVSSVWVSAEAMARTASECTTMDIMLVMDNSRSIDDSEHQELQTAAKTLVDQFCLDDSNGTRIGITRFSGSSAPVHDMSVDATSLKAAIDATNRGAKGLKPLTDIPAGLAGGAAQYSSGPGDRANAPNKMIFITDGNDSRGNSDARIALASLATGAEVFAISVGVSSVKLSTLNAIATDPDAKHSFRALDFVALNRLVKEVAAALTIHETLIE